MKLILFGAGNIGEEALSYFGRNNVFCFCDIRITGSDEGERFDIKIISFQKLKEIYESYIIVVCVGSSYVMEVCNQLDEAGMKSYFDYSLLKREKMLPENAQELIKLLQDKEERNAIPLQCYRKSLDSARRQLEYLKKHADITTLKPATGKLREKQIILTHLAEEFFEYTSELNIKPFLAYGSLIGAVRHQGFVPWDDDLDFAIMRSDYERLMEFAHENCTVACYDGDCDDICGLEASVYEILEQYPNRYLIYVGADTTKIYKQTPERAYKIMDLWVYDFYKNDYSIAEHMRYLGELSEKKHQMKSVKAVVDFLKNEREYKGVISIEKTRNIFPGIDNWGGYPGLKNASRWISFDDVFPLKKAHFEHTEFWMPKDAETVLSFGYQNYMEFPHDIGLNSHSGEYAD